MAKKETSIKFNDTKYNDVFEESPFDRGFLDDTREMEVGASTDTGNNKVIHIDRQGLWAGAHRFEDAPFSVSVDGTVVGAGSGGTDYFVKTDGVTITFDITTDGTYQSVVLGGNRTLAVSNVPVPSTFAIELIQDGTGNRTVTWFSGIKWDESSVPVLSTGANKIDVFIFKCISAGSYRGFVAAKTMG